jgi:hypothetical protein
MTRTQLSAVAREHSRALERSAHPWSPRAESEEAALSQWAAIDADYENALEDLLRLQWGLRQDGVEQRSKSPVALLTLGLRGQTIAWKALDRPAAPVGRIRDVPFGPPRNRRRPEHALLFSPAAQRISWNSGHVRLDVASRRLGGACRHLEPADSRLRDAEVLPR